MTQPTAEDFAKAKKLVDEKNAKWDERFLALAEHIAQWSHDPSTKVGAVITRPDRTISSVGYNGLPKRVHDTEDRLSHRETKYEMTVHAEANAILHATERPVGYTIYTWPFQPCSRCAGLIIQSGLKRVVAPLYEGDRWTESFALASQMFAEAFVRLDLIRATKRASSTFVCEPTPDACTCKPLRGNAFLFNGM